MSGMRITRGFAAMAAILAFAGTAFAAEDDTAPDNSNPAIPMYSGGIGDDEIDYIKNVEHQFDLKLLFTEENGVFLSDVPVSISDRQGNTVVNTVSSGPILLLNLPDGTYTVTATEGDKGQQTKVSLSAHALRIFQFRFPTRDPRPDNE